MISQQRLVRVPSKAISRRMRAMVCPAMAHSFRNPRASSLEKVRLSEAPSVSWPSAVATSNCR
jgi:hypothetical protein